MHFFVKLLRKYYIGDLPQKEKNETTEKGNTMKHNSLRKLMAAVLAVLLVASLAACGKKADGKEALLKAQEELKKVTSLQYSIQLKTAFTVDGQSVESSTTGVGKQVLSPMALEMTMDMDVLGTNMKDVRLYAIPENDDMVVYMGMDVGGGRQWMKTVGNMAGINTKQYGAASTLSLYMENGINAKAAGTEKVQGHDATRYDCVIPNSVLTETLRETGMLDQVTNLGVEESALNGIGDMAYTVWLDNSSGLPVKYNMDMTQLLQKALDKIAESADEKAEIKAVSYTMSFEISSYNDVSSIAVPQEVVDSAIDLTAMMNGAE